MNLPSTLAALATCVAVLATTPLLAAPIDSKDAAATTPGALGPGIDPATTLPVPGGGTGPASSTVELLLQMQNQPAAAPAPEGRPAAGKAATHAATGAKPTQPTQSTQEPASNALLELKSSLLGAGPALDGEGHSPRADRGNPLARVEGVSSYSGPRSTRAGAGDSDGGLLANPVIRFIRNNRELAIGGSIALLVAVWLTANYRGRSHRRR